MQPGGHSKKRKQRKLKLGEIVEAAFGGVSTARLGRSEKLCESTHLSSYFFNESCEFHIVY